MGGPVRVADSRGAPACHTSGSPAPGLSGPGASFGTHSGRGSVGLCLVHVFRRTNLGTVRCVTAPIGPGATADILRGPRFHDCGVHIKSDNPRSGVPIFIPCSNSFETIRDGWFGLIFLGNSLGSYKD